MENFQDITKFLLILSRKASEIMLKHYSAGGIYAGTKEDMSPVTKADTEINSIVIAEIKKNYPDYEIIGEEESTQTNGVKKLFVIDPLDGTLMFKIGSPLFAFSAAIVIDGEVVAGVLSNPLAKRTLLAEKHKGTYLVEENKRIYVSSKNIFEGALINAGWKETNLPKLLHERGARTPTLYAICEIASLVAVGGIEGSAYSGTYVYDIAAAKIIVEEAGGKVTDLYGNEQRYDQPINGAVISNGLLHDELLNLVKRAGLKVLANNK